MNDLHPLMKTKLFMAGWLAVVLFALGAEFGRAQNYSIGWSTIDGGGGTSTNAQFSLTGTIGQPDAAGRMTNGQFSVSGGFWAIQAVQTPGAPTLNIAQTATNALIVSWPSPSVGWTLQQNTNSVSSVSWSNVTSGIVDDGTAKTLTIQPPRGNRFYRLKAP